MAHVTTTVETTRHHNQRQIVRTLEDGTRIHLGFAEVVPGKRGKIAYRMDGQTFASYADLIAYAEGEVQ